MGNVRGLWAGSVSAVYGGGRFFLLYAAVSAAAAYHGAGLMAAVLVMAAGRFAECGLAGVIKDGLADPGKKTFRDFGMNAVRYFPRAFMAGVIIGGGVALFVSGSLFMMVMAGPYVPFLRMSIRGLENAVWSPATFNVALVLSGAWTLCAVSLVIYRGSGVVAAIVGSWAVIAGNRWLAGAYAAVYAASLLALNSVPQENAALYQLAGAASIIVVSAATATAYAGLFIGYRERDGLSA